MHYMICAQRLLFHLLKKSTLENNPLDELDLQ